MINETIEFNQVYRIYQGHCDNNAVIADGISRLSLFDDRELNIQVKDFCALFAQYQLEHELFFCLQDKPQGICWSIYAEYSVLVKLQDLLQSSEFDYLLWPEGVLQSPKLMLFDMDSTFIEIEVIDELAKRHQVGEQVSTVTEAAMRGELDFAQSLVSRVSCLKGLSETVIEQIALELPLSKGVVKLVEMGRANHCMTAIVSGGFSPFVEKLKNDLNLYQVKANNLEAEGGVLTGKVIGEIVDAQAKSTFLHELCQKLDIDNQQVIAIGDGANDLLMMQAAGFNLAYRAKPKVQQSANGRMNKTNLDRLADIFDWTE